MRSLYILRREGTGIGGAELVVKRFKSMFENNWHVTILSSGINYKKHKISGNKGPSWWKALRYANSVNSVIFADNPDIVFSMERGPKCDVYRAGDGVHKCYIKYKYGNSIRWIFNLWNWVAPFLEARTIQSAKIIIANSKMIKQDIEKVYPQFCNKVKTILNGFDPKRFYPPKSDNQELKDKLDIKSEKIILFCGSGWERKGLVETIKIFSELIQKGSYILIILGKGNISYYEKFSETLGVAKRVKFIKPQSDIRNYYQIADYMILPTEYDPFSNATLEALACGCPVITTINNGASEIIQNKKSGFIMKDRNNDIKAAAEWILNNNKLSKEEIAESVANLNIQNENLLYNEVFNDLVAAN